MCVQGLQTEVKARFSSVLRPIYISILFQDTALILIIVFILQKKQNNHINPSTDKM
jgi:hypothetical protein